MGVVAMCIVAALPASASAQGKPSYDPAIDVQMFQWSIGPKTFFSVDDGSLADKHQLAFDAVLTFITNPFVLYNAAPATPLPAPGSQTNVVSQLSAVQVSASYGLSDRLQLGAALPVILDLQGAALDRVTDSPGVSGLHVRGVGDLRLELKARLWRGHDARVSGIIGGTIPTSDGTENSQFTGDATPSGRLKLSLDWRRGPLTLGLNGGAVVRETRDIYGITYGSQALWGAAAAYRFADKLEVVAEGFGGIGLVASNPPQAPIEADAGLRLFATSSVAVVVGAGFGVNHGIGEPASQFFFAFSYAPDIRDSDGDGIPNTRDQCPLVPEDKDGFQDADGCPDDDNDGDRIPDAQDKCPNEPEDLDGFEDEDGCPDVDNDKDGIPDVDDKCPNEPEDGVPPFPHDGCPGRTKDSDGDGILDPDDKCPLEAEDFDHFEDGDGCPDLDNDGDGIPDAIDKCPLCPEDKDGFQDADGCPDLDNDNDGIPDARDSCPNEPETVNGFQDADGCPDTGGANLVRLDGDHLVIDKVPQLAGRALAPASLDVVEQMALVMAGHHDVAKWVIAVALPSASTAKLLAGVIKDELIKRGVAAEIMMVEKAGAAQIGGAVQERVDPDAPFVCPAGMQVKERPEAAARNPPPATAPTAPTDGAPPASPSP